MYDKILAGNDFIILEVYAKDLIPLSHTPTLLYQPAFNLSNLITRK